MFKYMHSIFKFNQYNLYIQMMNWPGMLNTKFSAKLVLGNYQKNWGISLQDTAGIPLAAQSTSKNWKDYKYKTLGMIKIGCGRVGSAPRERLKSNNRFVIYPLMFLKRFCHLENKHNGMVFCSTLLIN